MMYKYVTISVIYVNTLASGPLSYHQILQQLIDLTPKIQLPESQEIMHVTLPQQSAIQQNIPSESSDTTSYATNNSTIQDITNTLLPLIINPTLGKILNQDVTRISFEEQLDNAHMAAAFLTKLNTKMESLSPESLEYIKSPQFAEHALAKKLFSAILSLRSIFEERLEAYKNIKPQPTIVKELKKIITQQKKSVEKLLQESFGIQ